ncbi:MAG: YqgE/AlgH family protein [bacterium]
MIATDTLSPGFLIASPRLDGSVFERSVIVMVHHDAEGAMGFIVNKPIDVDLGTLLEMVDVDADRISQACYDETVFFGGPVRVEQLWVMEHSDTTRATAEEDIDFLPGWKVATSADTIKDLAFDAARGTLKPYMGYTGWGPGQLEGEIAEGSWLLLEFDGDLVFTHDFETVWATALERLGVSEMVFTMMGRAGEA